MVDSLAVPNAKVEFRRDAHAGFHEIPSVQTLLGKEIRWDTGTG
jgi:hypothetical protein